MVNTDHCQELLFPFPPFSNDAAVYTINRQASRPLTRSQRFDIRRRRFYIQCLPLISYDCLKGSCFSADVENIQNQIYMEQNRVTS